MKSIIIILILLLTLISCNSNEKVSEPEYKLVIIEPESEKVCQVGFVVNGYSEKNKNFIFEFHTEKM